MEPLREYEGIVYPLNRVNVDTDQIIPKQFLKRIERQGFGQFLFYHWRFDDQGELRENFLLNNEQYRDASILVAGQNFGCGSSREHAPWALLDYGFRVIIAPSFADIFYNNCFKNGVLPIKLKEEEVDQLLENAKQPYYKLTVNLEKQTVYDNHSFQAYFDIDSYPKEMLMNGRDEIAMTLTLDDKITAYEQKKQALI
ncbi:3-isopropylmalate/(R)-2-methylmalate dehydratase small subunit [Scopulibacillus daqui]|uniref:3-isopropylmalate dehydratase small subunit n=1 Tax=Scopulibacillus daqui TaxID=1469162 RepID=A0ABS2PYS4_9BACL|nr:3-isopropylmalate dehydratase small subunit [Scopulibacillus daqui]MBM7645116.1 3-isopropylmalate/(R)-2-methylmalate dehydratase small subunit [Scopulibacillus daqui]